MAIIGSFTKTDNGFAGRIHMLNVDAKARMIPAESTNDRGPAFRILAGQAEIGAAWKRTSEAGRDYFSVKLDDPTFQRPVERARPNHKGEFRTLRASSSSGFGRGLYFNPRNLSSAHLKFRAKSKFLSLALLDLRSSTSTPPP